jgi:quercetin dioxygenase-like cupin family protein
MDWLADDTSHSDIGLSLARMTVLPGKTSPAHRHPNCNEVIHVLSGHMSERLDSKWQTASPGETIFVPAGTVHQTRCDSDEAAVMIIAYSEGARIYEEVNL